jgi:hypothetical protein
MTYYSSARFFYISLQGTYGQAPFGGRSGFALPRTPPFILGYDLLFETGLALNIIYPIKHVKIEHIHSNLTYNIILMTVSPHNKLLQIIQHQTDKESQSDIWKSSPYRDLAKLQSNNVGNVGEMLIDSICQVACIPACCDGTKTKYIGGDGTISDCSVEIKTALQGSMFPSFQHELGETPWKGASYMIFVDISPNCIYLTVFPNFDEATYKSKNKLSCFPTKSITWRKKMGAFKLDTTVKINEYNIVNANTIKITPDTPNEYVATFIQQKISQVVPI